MMHLKMFDDIKAWLAPMIRIPDPSWLEEGEIIENK